MEKITDRLFSWASILDEKARAQALTTSTMPFIHPHLALMPDAHLGLGAGFPRPLPRCGACGHASLAARAAASAARGDMFG